MANDVYSNHPVRQRKQEIRLVEFKAGSQGDQLQCNLIVKSLLEFPEYEALSYACGGQEVRDIVVDGRAFKVSINLQAALLQLRLPTGDRILWIDALCINQNDDQEKSWQVDMMDKIYKSCKRGLFFLGKRNVRSDVWCTCRDRSYECKEAKAVGRPWHRRRPDLAKMHEFINQLGSAKMAAMTDHLNHIPSIADLQDPSDNKNDNFMEPIQAVGALMRRSWWSRMWTVQEAILPPDALVICGDICLEWKALVRAAKSWEDHTTAGCCHAVNKEMNYTLRYQTHGRRTSAIMKEFCNQVGSIERIRKQRNEGLETRFLPVFQHFRHREAENDLDKVYALLGLVKEDLRPCSVMYGKKMPALNRELSIHFLSKSTRNPFEALYGRSVSPKNLSSPSWQVSFARSWSRYYQEIEDQRSGLRGEYRASGARSAEVTVLDAPFSTTLLVAGAKVDEVEHTSQVFQDYDRAAMKAFCVWCSSRIGYHERKAYAYPSDEEGRQTFLTRLLKPSAGRTVEKAFQRAIIGNRCQNQGKQKTFRQAEVQDLRSLEKWMFSEETVKDGLLSQIKCTIYNRKFFTTKGGLVGFGPSDMIQGDEVWLIYGDQVPFILRPLRTRDGHQEHGVVGDCYVQGVMQGQAVNGIRETQIFLK